MLRLVESVNKTGLLLLNIISHFNVYSGFDTQFDLLDVPEN